MDLEFIFFGGFSEHRCPIPANHFSGVAINPFRFFELFSPIQYSPNPLLATERHAVCMIYINIFPPSGPSGQGAFSFSVPGKNFFRVFSEKPVSIRSDFLKALVTEENDFSPTTCPRSTNEPRQDPIHPRGGIPCRKQKRPLHVEPSAGRLPRIPRTLSPQGQR